MNAVLKLEDYVGDPPEIPFSVTQLATSASSLEVVEKQTEAQLASLRDLLLKANDAPPEAIDVVATDMEKLERRHAETLVPMIETADRAADQILYSKRRGTHTAAEKSLMRMADRFAKALASWLEGLRDTRIALHLLAHQKREAMGAARHEIKSDQDLDDFFRSIAGQ